jgi:BCD family chlorophyll transporter-like MFS transporter
VGALVGIVAFAAVIFAAPIGSPAMFAVGVGLIGLGGGLFAHGTLTASMALARPQDRGLALGAWGAAQATAAGLAIAFSGIVNDFVSSLALQGAFGEALVDPVTGYAVVYTTEILLLFATLVAIGPLVRPSSERAGTRGAGFQLSPNPGHLSGVLQ